jgi:hypothetical protein
MIPHYKIGAYITMLGTAMPDLADGEQLGNLGNKTLLKY